MQKLVINEETLVAIGDAIREKTGSEDTYSPQEMVTAIIEIETDSGEYDNGEVIKW